MQPAEKEQPDEEIAAALGAITAPPRFVRWLADGSTFALTRFVVLRLLGVVYFVAFASAFVQARALIGDDGLLPAKDYLADVAAYEGSRWSGFLSMPTLFWIHFSDAWLAWACAIGAILALAVVLGVTNAGVMIALWVLQLSLTNVGQAFWSYGWEIQLLETGLLAALLCPMRGWRPFGRPTSRTPRPPLAAIWLLRWLIARIMLGAGLIKLRGDPCWRELTCLVFHYETQPNPSPGGWLLHHAPHAFHVAGALFNFFVELVCPFLILGPRRARRIAGGFFVAFQVVLIFSGNLSFLNWLTIVPALACFDDDLLAPLFRVARLRVRVPDPTPPSKTHTRVATAYALVVAILSASPIANLLSERQAMNASFEPLHLVNTYGAFGSVNRTRDELVIEGSDDGATWKEYELPCKPGDVNRRPCIVSPWHYRLDWQMWFAAMSSLDDEPWLAALVDKMLRGDRVIEPLLAYDPFPDAPPKLVRIDRYRYTMSPLGSRTWWTRRRLGPYLRPVTKDDPDLEAFLALHRLRR